MDNSGTKKLSKDKDESWWNKRHKEMTEIMKQQEEKSYRKAIASKKEQEKEWLRAQVGAGNASANIGVAIQGYEKAISTFSNSMIGNIDSK